MGTRSVISSELVYRSRTVPRGVLKMSATGSRKFKRGRKKHSENSKEPGRNHRFTVLSAASICVLITLFSIVAWKACNRPSTVGMDYEGVIVDRWAGYHESDLGARPYFRLLIEDENRGRITVSIDADTYHRAQVGMRVSRRKGKVELGNQQTKRE
jgi:hypothetical protein